MIYQYDDQDGESFTNMLERAIEDEIRRNAKRNEMYRHQRRVAVIIIIIGLAVMAAALRIGGVV